MQIHSTNNIVHQFSLIVRVEVYFNSFVHLLYWQSGFLNVQQWDLHIYSCISYSSFSSFPCAATNDVLTLSGNENDPYKVCQPIANQLGKRKQGYWNANRMLFERNINITMARSTVIRQVFFSSRMLFFRSLILL